MKLVVVLLVASAVMGASATAPGQRRLTLDDRLRAQAAIERVDGPQSIGAEQTAALEAYWKISVTDELLERELARLAREMNPPQRLGEFYAALGNDPFLAKECLARPSLVLRLSRESFAFDPTLHAKAKAAAEDLKRRLATGELSPLADDPGRSVVELSLRETDGAGPFPPRLSPEEFRRRRALLPDAVFQVSALEEERETFVLNVVLDETAESFRVARYAVPKTTWEAWWSAAKTTLRAGPVVAVAGNGGPLPLPAVGPAGRRVVSGTLDSASDLDLFAFCASAGDTIDLALDGDPDRDLAGFHPSVLVIDDSGTPLTPSGTAWVAPATGAYSAVVSGDATATRGEYLLSIGVGGPTGAPETVDLSVTMEVVPEPAEAGGLLTYTIVMTNAGPGTALDATMLDPLPVGTTHESLTWTGTEGIWDCLAPPVGANGKVSCTNKCFGPGGTVTFTVNVRIDPCAGASELKNTASASSLMLETNPADNTAIAATTIVDPGVCDDGNVCTAGDRCGPEPGFEQSFDLVVAPAIPPGWTAALVVGPPGAGTWKTKAFVFDTAPNSAFVPDASDIRDCILDSPRIAILSSNARLSFRNYYDLERDFDGGVLEIQLGDGPFRDILAAGGSFETGGYTGTISERFNSPISGRRAWTGANGRFDLTIVNLPAAAFGQNIVLRWRMATDQGLGTLGQWIDSISVTGRNSCQPGTSVDCDDNDACTADSCDAAFGCLHAPVSCDDGNPCTDEACDAVLQCVYTDNNAPCDDQNACTQADGCRLGVCVGSRPATCHDADVCTADACDPAIGCVTATANFDTTGFSSSRVDGRDLAVLAGSWNSCPGDARYDPAANLDRQDACVGATDFHLFMSAFGRNCAP